MMRVVYVDNNATTRVDPAVAEAMTPYLTELYGNPSSMHNFGGQVGRAIEDARSRVAECLGAAHATEIVFMSCGTESDNTAIRSALASRKKRKRVITTRVEHPAVHTVARHLEREGYEVTYLPVDANGLLSPDVLREKMDEDVALVSIMAANNETGVLFPVEELGQVAHEYDALFHTDAVQAVGKVPVDLSSGSIDLLSLSGHKIPATKGVLALYIRAGRRGRPGSLGCDHGRG